MTTAFEELEKLLKKEKQPKPKKKPALDLNLHPAQMEVFISPERYKVLCTSRRFGKSRLLLTVAISKALEFKGNYDKASPPVVVILMPTLKQAKTIHWGPLCNLLAGHPAVKRIYKNENRIELVDGLPDIILRGGNEDSGDGLRGLKIYYICIDEVQDLKEIVWAEVVRPALTDTPNSGAFFVGTPKGQANWFYSLFHTKNEEWKGFSYTIYDNPYIDPKEIELTRKSLPPRIFQQEFMASFTSFSGRIYSSLTEEHYLEDEYAFGLEYSEYFLGIDFGDVNPALVVVGRRRSTSPRPSYVILDSWKNPNKNSAVEAHVFLDKAKELVRKWDCSRSFADPTQPSKILTWRKENIPKLLKGFNPVSEGNGLVDTLFFQKRLKIVRSQKEFYNELLSYRRDEKDGLILESVAKGQEDHRCDALRYVLATLERKSIKSFLDCEGSKYSYSEKENDEIGDKYDSLF